VCVSADDCNNEDSVVVVVVVVVFTVARVVYGSVSLSKDKAGTDGPPIETSTANQLNKGGIVFLLRVSDRNLCKCGRTIV
jgi:hypothetical protein